MREGLFIVIYGINNLGKTTQAKMLVESFQQAGLAAEYLKYPIYDLAPTGPKINEILRSGEKQLITEEELQKIYVQNRVDYQPQLCKKISEGVNIVAEDYSGTGIAWGWSKGADLVNLIALNKGLLKPDIEILLDGERFIGGKEENHLHESNDELMDKCRANHLLLAARFGWQVVGANQTVEEVQWDILQILERRVKEINQ